MYINKISVYQNSVYGKKFPTKKKQEISFQGVKGALTGSFVGYFMTLGVLGMSNAAKPENSTMPLIITSLIGACCGSKLEDKNNDNDDNNDNFKRRMRRI